MFVPIVPLVPHTTHATVVNKTIVYSDTVLPVKDLGNNLKVSTISDVSEYSLERCLQIIFESNPNVIFNTIQYSKNDKKVYFYTNQVITTKAYEESKFTSYKPITSITEILEEVKNVLLSPKNEDLYVVKSESYCTDKVFSALCSTLSEMYDELLKYADYKDYKHIKNNIKPVNSNFSVKISHHGIWLSVEDFTNKYLKELELFAPSYKSSYELDCNSSIVNEAFNGKEYEIFKSIFIRIDDCPEWSQAMLYEMRQNQLEEERRIEEKKLLERQKIEEEIQRRETKKQKRLELTRKFFPFLKK